MSVSHSSTSVPIRAFALLALSLFGSTGCGDSDPTYIINVQDAGTAGGANAGGSGGASSTQGGEAGEASGSGGSVGDNSGGAGGGGDAGSSSGGAGGSGDAGGSSGAGGVATGGGGAGGSAGAPAGAIGAPCANDSECASGVCVPETDEVGPTGWTDGYCMSVCKTHNDCLPDGLCVVLGADVNACLANCASSPCRTGYVCEQSGEFAFCSPNCNYPGVGCIEGAVCREDGMCEIPVNPPPTFDEPFVELSVSPSATTGDHACALAASGEIACWGADWDCCTDPTPPPGPFIHVEAGHAHACAIRPNGTLVCWGSDFQGNLNVPAGVYVQVSAGYGHSCAVRQDGQVICWGRNFEGQATPPSGTFLEVAAGYSHSCGIRTDGTLTCWGDSTAYWDDGAAPSGIFKDVSVERSTTCALGSDDLMSCWGNYAPAGLEGSYLQVSVGFSDLCGVATDQTIVCQSDEPPAGTFSQVSVGDRSACALTTEGMVQCWGEGELHNGTVVTYITLCVPGSLRCDPREVSGPPAPQVCSPKGDAWVSEPACVDQACVAGVCSGECEPDYISFPSQRCNDVTRETCSDQGTWIPKANINGPLPPCEAACFLDDAGRAQCSQCLAGQARCDGIYRQTCDASGSFADEELCPSACVQGACIQGEECDSGDRHCQDANNIVRCTSEGTWAAPAECFRGCVDDACFSPPECDELALCCLGVSGLERITCENVSERGSALACSDYLDYYGC